MFFRVYSGKGRCIERHQVWLFWFGPGPVFLLVCFLGGETQVWLGDLRVVFFVVLFCLVVTWIAFILVLANCAMCLLFCTAYVSIRTVPQSITAKLEEKKQPHFWNLWGLFPVAVLKQASMELGGQNWVLQKHKLRPKIGANFWAPLLIPFASRVMLLFQNTLIQRARFKHGRPTWRDRFSNQNQAPFPGLWNHAEVKATSQIAPRVVQKVPVLIRSGKYLLGVRIASMWFNYKDERRLALGTTWCKVTLYFVRSCFILYRILCIWHLHVHGDHITLNISMYILCCSGTRLYKFYGVAIRIYSAECDGCACRECHMHCLTRWCESCHWQWYLLERIEVGQALSERS